MLQRILGVSVFTGHIQASPYYSVGPEHARSDVDTDT